MIRGIFKDNEQAFRILLVAFVLMAVNKVTAGWGLFVLFPMSVYFAAQRKMGAVALCYTFLTFMANLNSSLTGGVNGMVYRITFVAMTCLLVVQGSQRRGVHKIPLWMMYGYLIVAMVSSIGGYCPAVSYLKIANFVLFLLGLHFSTCNLHHHPSQIATIRSGFLAFSVLLIAGSVAVMPFPSIGYSMELANYHRWGVDDRDAAVLLESVIHNGFALYSGVTNHSQALAPFVVCMGTWLLCDMLLIEGRFSPIHVCLLCLSPLLLFKTKSRVGLLGMLTALMVINFYTLPSAAVDLRMKRRLRSGFSAALFLMVVMAVVLEVSHGTMSKWLRKRYDVENDRRSLQEAMTASRQGAVEQNMYDFRQNVALGTGFQVSYDVGERYRISGSIPFFAPIEKGILPLMILGETGIVGALVFLVFMVVFVGTCLRRRYVATLTLFCVMLSCNMGEATFFAPTAIGGCFWLVSCTGGFAIDMYCLYFRNQWRFEQTFPLHAV